MKNGGVPAVTLNDSDPAHLVHYLDAHTRRTAAGCRREPSHQPSCKSSRAKPHKRPARIDLSLRDIRTQASRTT